MLCYLSKMRNDRYVLSKELPKLSQVGQTGKFDLYPKIGDEIWYPNFCEVVALLARRRLEFGDCIIVEITIKTIGEIIKLETCSSDQPS